MPVLSLLVALSGFRFPSEALRGIRHIVFPAVPALVTDLSKASLRVLQAPEGSDELISVIQVVTGSIGRPLGGPFDGKIEGW